jgi:aminopeptidase
MIATPGADHIGEFSMTDNRLSRITKFMAETLFDENVGGKYGNSHIALGHAIRDTYPGNKKTLTEKQWLKMGYNESVIHTDIFTTEDRTVTATLENGKIVVIYRKGRFTI